MGQDKVVSQIKMMLVAVGFSSPFHLIVHKCTQVSHHATLQLVASCQWLCLYFSVFFPPSNSNVMEHRPAVNLLPNEVLSEMVTEEENKGRMSYWRRRLACSVTRLSRICLSKTFPLLTSFWHPRHCLWSFSLSFVQSHQHYVTNYKSNPASLNAFLHIGHPYWRQQIYAKAEKSSFCSSLQCW